MNSHSAQVGELIDELHEVNEQLAEAARPLQWLSDLDFDKRQEIAAKIIMAARVGNTHMGGITTEWRSRLEHSAAKEQIR